MTSSPVIADTGFWVALTNRSDTHHARAVEVLEGLERRLVTTGRCSPRRATFCCAGAAAPRNGALSKAGSRAASTSTI